MFFAFQLVQVYLLLCFCSFAAAAAVNLARDFQLIKHGLVEYQRGLIWNTMKNIEKDWFNPTENMRSMELLDQTAQEHAKVNEISKTLTQILHKMNKEQKELQSVFEEFTRDLDNGKEPVIDCIYESCYSCLDELPVGCVYPDKSAIARFAIDFVDKLVGDQDDNLEHFEQIKFVVKVMNDSLVETIGKEGQMNEKVNHIQRLIDGQIKGLQDSVKHGKSLEHVYKELGLSVDRSEMREMLEETEQILDELKKKLQNVPISETNSEKPMGVSQQRERRSNLNTRISEGECKSDSCDVLDGYNSWQEYCTEKTSFCSGELQQTLHQYTNKIEEWKQIVSNEQNAFRESLWELSEIEKRIVDITCENIKILAGKEMFAFKNETNPTIETIQISYVPPKFKIDESEQNLLYTDVFVSVSGLAHFESGQLDPVNVHQYYKVGKEVWKTLKKTLEQQACETGPENLRDIMKECRLCHDSY